MDKNIFLDKYNNLFISLAAVFNKTFESIESIMMIYLKTLQGAGLSYEKILEVMQKALSVCQFFPRPAELINIGKPSKEDDAVLQAEIVLNKLRLDGSSDKNPVWDDPITARIMGPKWLTFCQTHLVEDDGYFKHNFEKQYKAYARHEYKDEIEYGGRQKRIENVNVLTENIGKEF